MLQMEKTYLPSSVTRFQVLSMDIKGLVQEST